MAPKKTGKASDSQAKTDSQHSDATSMDASQSQDIDTKSLQELLNQHKQQIKQRRRERKEAIVTAHEAHIEKLRRDTAKAYAEHEEAVRVIERSKVQPLLELVRKRNELGQKLDECVDQMEKTFLMTAEKYQIAVDARLDEPSP